MSQNPFGPGQGSQWQPQQPPPGQYGQGQYGPGQGTPYGNPPMHGREPGGYVGPGGQLVPHVGPGVHAPYGIDPMTGLPYSDKSKLVAGLLGIFLGGLGVGRFYTGHIGLGIGQLVASFFFGAGVLWGLIDGIVMLAGRPRDAQGRPLRP